MTRLGGKVREEDCGRIRNDLAITERGFLSDASTIRHGDEITQTSSGGCGLELPIECRRSWHGSIMGGRVDTTLADQVLRSRHVARWYSDNAAKGAGMQTKDAYPSQAIDSAGVGTK